jgi:hypothetical protein
MYSTTLHLVTILIQLLIFFSSHWIHFPEWLINTFGRIYWPLLPLPRDSANGNGNDKTNDHNTNANPPIQIIRPYRIISSTMNHMILLLSFGLCSPALGFYIAIGICVNLVTWLMLIGRFIFLRIVFLKNRNEESMTSPSSSPSLVNELPKELLNLLNQQVEVEKVQSSLLVCKWPIICTSCLFVTLLSWDMVGDQVGWYEGLWVPITGVVMLLLIWFWDRLLKRHLRDQSQRSASNSVELVTSSLHQLEVFS